jgi:hypothetical protein
VVGKRILRIDGLVPHRPSAMRATYFSSEKEESSFLKKRSKRLLIQRVLGDTGLGRKGTWRGEQNL